MDEQRTAFEFYPVRAIAFAALALASIVGLFAQDSPPVPTVSLPANALLVERYEWHDADTPVRAVVRLPWGVLLDEPKGLRDDSYDAWEVGERGGADVTPEERLKGLKAVDALRVLSVGRSLYVAPSGRGKRDNFGRLLGSMYLVDGGGRAIRLRDWAVSNGHVRKTVK